MSNVMPSSPARTRMPEEYERSGGSRDEGASLLDYSPSRAATTPDHAVNRSVGSSATYAALIQNEVLGVGGPLPPVAGGGNENLGEGTGIAGGRSGGGAPASASVLRFGSGHAGAAAPSTPPRTRGSALREAMAGLSPLAVSPGTASSPLVSPGRAARRISKAAFKVLDAPNLQDDFYLNLLDWSSRNVLAVALGDSLYLWNASTAEVSHMCSHHGAGLITSVSWSDAGKYVAIGMSTGLVSIWDATCKQRLRSIRHHPSRVAACAWNGHLLVTGSRDHSVCLHDVRTRAPPVSLPGHRQEVCGVRWSPDARYLATGGNDNTLAIWDWRQRSLLHRFPGHEAAVKAIAWSPHQSGLIASGGGTADRCIKIWNVNAGVMVNSIDTGSQVCNLAWAQSVNEIVSTHGFSLNQVVVWRYPAMTKLATLTGHTSRVLYLAMSPDGQTAVTGAGDETIRFWNLFPSAKGASSTRLAPAAMLPGSPDIR